MKLFGLFGPHLERFAVQSECLRWSTDGLGSCYKTTNSPFCLYWTPLTSRSLIQLLAFSSSRLKMAHLESSSWVGPSNLYDPITLRSSPMRAIALSSRHRSASRRPAEPMRRALLRYLFELAFWTLAASFGSGIERLNRRHDEI